MIDISLQNVKKSFTGTEILHGVSFDICSGERAALLGPNGAGKTTLLRILTGELEPDEGTVMLAPGKRVGLISQIPLYPNEYTVEDVLRSAFRHLDAIREQMTALESSMSSAPSKEIFDRYDHLTAEFERLGGYNTEFELNRVANGLDLSDGMRRQSFDSLSGGEKTRVNLARLLLEDTEILLLDEPTNHLDLKSTQWLEEFLLKFKGTVLIVSHDRWFLDTVVQRTIELDGGVCSFFAGNYSFYLEEKQRRYEELRRQYEKNQKEIAHLEEAARTLRLWAFLGNDKLYKRAFSMEKRMAKLQTAAPGPVKKKALTARFKEQEFFGDEVLTVRDLSKSFGEKLLFQHLDLLIRPGEHVAIMGDNGSGKSTLVKIILGELTPDSGYTRIGPSVRTAYLPQQITFSHPERTLLDTLLYEDKEQPQQARDRLASFHFSGEDALKTVGSLSGGEQSRLRLCMLMKSNINFLVLDEPTNHLDIASREWIERALDDYGGTLLFVSHDRWFTDRFATRIWEINRGTLTDYVGSYHDFEQYKARQLQLSHIEKHKETKSKAARPARTTDASKQIAKVEREIEKLEASLEDINKLEAENASDYHKLMELDQERSTLQSQLDALYTKWEELSDL